MNRNISPSPWVMPQWARSWERFWFTPMDPTVLGLIRLCTGMMVFYILFAYTFQLQDFMGVHAWLDLYTRQDVVHNRALMPQPLWGDGTLGPAVPTTPAEKDYAEKYLQKFKVGPPAPFPTTPDESDYIDAYIQNFGFDLRSYGLRPPATDEEREYLVQYTRMWRMPPPAYPATKEEEQAIDAYLARYGADPRRVYAKGVPVFSLWFHVTDPSTMALLHGLIVAVSFLFAIGFCTRVTSAFTWFALLCYIHRNPQVQFGMDTMMVILLTYLMIGPSGAAYSVDRVISRWWSRAKPGVIQRWYRLLGRPEPATADIAPAHYSPTPEPSISANFAMRLLQIHVCIVYLAAGLSKLQGTSWWDGTAVWGTLANPEFAPFQLKMYDTLLRWMSRYSLALYLFMNVGTLFTLAFEIGYAFLIWRPGARWFFLAAALILHGLIGLFMGLKTFSLIMLIMNMAFLRTEEADWLTSWFIPSAGPTPPSRAQPAEPVAVASAP
jgi:hypothetical protein